MNNIKMLPSLLIFAEVAHSQSFTLAATRVGMSKSAVSQQIKRLEQYLGQQLLSRHTRGMSLTAAGEKLLSRCELLQDQVHLAFELLNTTKETPTGTFALTIPHSCEREIVIPALKQLCVEFPGLEPKVVVTDEAVDLIQGNLDVALYAGTLKDSNYRVLPIGSASEIFCATPAYVQKYGEPDGPNDLARHRWIGAPWQGARVPLYANEELVEPITVDTGFFARTNTLPSALEMVLHHMGLALVPDFVVQSNIASGELVRLLPNHQGRVWPFYLVHRFHGDKPIHITRFHQLVAHYFAKAAA